MPDRSGEEICHRLKPAVRMRWHVHLGRRRSEMIEENERPDLANFPSRKGAENLCPGHQRRELGREQRLDGGHAWSTAQAVRIVNVLLCRFDSFTLLYRKYRELRNILVVACIRSLLCSLHPHRR